MKFILKGSFFERYLTCMWGLRLLGSLLFMANGEVSVPILKNLFALLFLFFSSVEPFGAPSSVTVVALSSTSTLVGSTGPEIYWSNYI